MLRVLPRAQITTSPTHFAALTFSTMAHPTISKPLPASLLDAPSLPARQPRSLHLRPAGEVPACHSRLLQSCRDDPKAAESKYASPPRVLAMLTSHPGQILQIPVLATTQNKARLGETVPELMLDAPAGIKTLVHADKTLFSMLTPEVRTAMASLASPLSCVIVGIESHICVTQTALALLREGHTVYVIADGVSSVNKEEVPIALARLRHAGAQVVTSESWMYEAVGDANTPEFKELIKLVKESAQSTRESLQALCKM
ncbi:hypothetical protein PMIN02_012979 [Paraphaeosphaeria minitans]